MRVRSSGGVTAVRKEGSLQVGSAGRMIHRPEWSEEPTKFNNGTLSAQAVNAYPKVAALMRRHANAIAARARASYLSMKDTGDLAASVRVDRGKSLQGRYVGAPHDFTVSASGKYVAHLEFGHRIRKGAKGVGNWVPGRFVMTNAARGAGPATPASVRRLGSDRSRRLRRLGRRAFRNR